MATDIREEMLKFLIFDLGYILIPLHPNEKRPLVKWGQYTINKPEPEVILGWFHKFPTADFGILTGRFSGVMALDFDKPPYLDEGEYTQTPSGGRHYFYKWQEHHRHGLGVRDGLDIPYIVKLYAFPKINPGDMPINGTSNEVRVDGNSQFVEDDDKPDMEDLEVCDFISWFRQRRGDSLWDGRYPLARAYASNTIQAENPDLDLGPGYRHTETIVGSVKKPITCTTIVRSGFECPNYDRWSGLCKRTMKSTTPYGLAKIVHESNLKRDDNGPDQA